MVQWHDIMATEYMINACSGCSPYKTDTGEDSLGSICVNSRFIVIRPKLPVPATVLYLPAQLLVALLSLLIDPLNQTALL